MPKYVNRDTVLRCIKESRENIDWGQSEDEDAFLHYSACLYRTIASIECLPDACVAKVVRCKHCRHYETDNGWCEFFNVDRVYDDFCSEGELKKEWLNT